MKVHQGSRPGLPLLPSGVNLENVTLQEIPEHGALKGVQNVSQPESISNPRCLVCQLGRQVLVSLDEF